LYLPGRDPPTYPREGDGLTQTSLSNIR
jgi:hypothetical protein